MITVSKTRAAIDAAIAQDIKWRADHLLDNTPGAATPAFKAGFIRGLRQARSLVAETCSALRIDEARENAARRETIRTAVRKPRTR